MKRQLQGKKGRNKENKRGYLRNFIVFLAVLNLVLLFVFDYRVPGLAGVMDKIENRKSAQYTSMIPEKGKTTQDCTIQFKKDVLYYNGEGEFDALYGVTVTDAAGNIYNNDNLTVEISGDDKETKTIRYQYSDSAGNKAFAERKLKLSDYDGPSIEIEEELPLYESGEDNPKNLYSGYYSAQDGFGLDITSDVTILAKENEDGTTDLTFKVKNQYGDTQEETRKVDNRKEE